MKVEIGKTITVVELLAFIQKNNEGTFTSKGDKIYFTTDNIPEIVPRQPVPQLAPQPAPQYYAAQPAPQPRQQKGAFSIMGDQLNEMCGL